VIFEPFPAEMREAVVVSLFERLFYRHFPTFRRVSPVIVAARGGDWRVPAGSTSGLRFWRARDIAFCGSQAGP